MYDKKKILYILRYDFENGQPIKPRYLIVIDNDESSSLVLSIVTSKNAVPDTLLKHGCIHVPQDRIHCHVFLKETIIGDNGFCFPKDSFIYINPTSVFKVNSINLSEKYKDNTEIKDCLTNQEYIDLIYCIYKSPFIPRGIKAKIESTLNDLCE